MLFNRLILFFIYLVVILSKYLIKWITILKIISIISYIFILLDCFLWFNFNIIFLYLLRY